MRIKLGENFRPKQYNQWEVKKRLEEVHQPTSARKGGVDKDSIGFGLAMGTILFPGIPVALLVGELTQPYLGAATILVWPIAMLALVKDRDK